MTALCSKTRGVYSWNDRCGCQIPTGDGRTSNDMTTLLRELHLIRTPLAMSCLHVVTQCYKIILNCHELHPFGPWTNGTYRTVDVDPLVAFGLSGCPCFWCLWKAKDFDGFECQFLAVTLCRSCWREALHAKARGTSLRGQYFFFLPHSITSFASW